MRGRSVGGGRKERGRLGRRPGDVDHGPRRARRSQAGEGRRRGLAGDAPDGGGEERANRWPGRRGLRRGYGTARVTHAVPEYGIQGRPRDPDDAQPSHRAFGRPLERGSATTQVRSVQMARGRHIRARRSRERMLKAANAARTSRTTPVTTSGRRCARTGSWRLARRARGSPRGRPSAPGGCGRRSAGWPPREVRRTGARRQSSSPPPFSGEVEQFGCPAAAPAKRLNSRRRFAGWLRSDRPQSAALASQPRRVMGRERRPVLRLGLDAPPRPHGTRREDRLPQRVLQLDARGERVARPLAPVAERRARERQVVARLVDEPARDAEIEQLADASRRPCPSGSRTRPP